MGEILAHNLGLNHRACPALLSITNALELGEDADGDGMADDLAVGAMASGTATYVFTQDDKFTFTEFSRMVRHAGNLKTKMLAAVVDAENAVNYYAVDRVTP